MRTEPLSTVEQMFAAVTGRALVEVIEEEMCSREQIRKAAHLIRLHAPTEQRDLASALERLADGFDNIHSGPLAVMEEIVKG